MAMLALAACSDDTKRELLPEENEAHDGVVSLHFRMRLSESGVPGVSRAGDIPADRTPGTSRENVVNTVCLFIYDADSNKFIDHIDLSESQVAAIMSSEGLFVPIPARKGNKLYIYAVANPTEGMRRLFSTGENGMDMSFVSDHNDYWDMINDFVPESGGHQTTLESSATASIPMTGVFKAEGADGDVITIPDDHTELRVSADMSRIVAKMHVLAVTETHNGVVYAHAEDKSTEVDPTVDENEEYSKWIGWIRLSDVHYMPNGTNRSTYIFPHVNEKGALTDCNMNLNDYVTNSLIDSRLYDRDFVFYNGMSLHETNAATPDRFAHAEAFDQRRMDLTIGTDDPDRYTQGMYCPENYFDIPDNTDFYYGQKNAIPMVTHLSIAAKLVPRYLLVLTDFPEKLDNFFDNAKENGFSDSFYKSYDITKADIDLEKDAKLWDDIKKIYFGEDYNRKDPVNNEKYGRSQVFRDDFYMFPARNIEEANCFINWSLIVRGLWSGDDNAFNNGKYPGGTYFVYDTDYDDKYDGISTLSDTGNRKYLYLVAGAVEFAKDKNIGIKLHSVPHVGGWGYYYTYIDDKSTSKGVIPFTASQVTRNTYYIITVENFGIPGGTITDPEYIKVNTESVGWDYTGKGDIILH